MVVFYGALYHRHDPYVGRLATGRIHSGSIKVGHPAGALILLLRADECVVCVEQVGDSIQVLNLESKQLETGKITKLYVTKGVAKSEVTSAAAGTICVQIRVGDVAVRNAYPWLRLVLQATSSRLRA